MRHIAPVLLVLAIANSCTLDHGLVGLPAREVDDARKQARLLLEDVHEIERAIEQGFGPERPGAEPRDPLRYYSYRAALEAQLVLADDHFDYTIQYQCSNPGRPPFVLFPRSVLPAIPESAIVRSEDGTEERCWFLPVVVSKEQLYWSEDFSSKWLGFKDSRISFDDPGVHYETYLVPHASGKPAASRSKAIMNYRVSLEPIKVELAGGVHATLPSMVDSRVVYAFALPLRTESNPGGIEPGYYSLRSFPRLQIEPDAYPLQRPISVALLQADWSLAIRELRELRAKLRASPSAPQEWRPWLTELARVLEEFPPKWFDLTLDLVLERVSSAVDADPDELEKALVKLEDAMLAVERADAHHLPVLLEAPADRGEPFSFVVGSDLQYTRDMTLVHQFLGMLDGAMLPHSGVKDAPHALVSKSVLERLRDARFVVLVGDLSDGAGLSSSPGAAIGSSLGLTPPTSPYGEDFADLQRVFARFRLPIFAVPGNHDGFASYGGILNDACASSGSLLRSSVIPFPIHLVTHPLGQGLSELGNFLPTIAKVWRLGNKPFFDGLVEWRYKLGPVHFAFRYRGHTFVGLNTYNLDVKYRDQVGPLANNWGGGVDRNDAVWFDLMLRWMRERNATDGSTGPGHQFAFLHHDPRAGRPFLRTYEESDFGEYDTVDVPFNTLTFGYLGLGWSPHNPLWLPIITPIANNLPRQAIYGDAKFNQEWMIKDGLFDADHYGARQLVDAITWNLDGPAPPGGLSHIFFGHDDVPARSKWIHDDQAGRVFPTPPGVEWPDSKWGSPGFLTTPFFCKRTVAPPEWGRELRREDGHNAVVMRCDDIGQRGSMHGFYLVTIDPRRERKDQVAVEWIQIPD